MIINTKYMGYFKAIKELKSGDIFEYEEEIYMVIDGNYRDNVIHLMTGRIDEINEDEVVMLPTKEPELNINFLKEI